MAIDFAFAVHKISLLNDEAEQLKRTGKTLQEETSDITTESAPSQSGKLENRLIETSWVTIPLECGKFLRCFFI